MQQYKVISYNSANINLNSILYFCEEKYGIKYATKTVSRIIQTFKSLEIFPHSNRIYYSFNGQIFRKKIVNNRYLIIFTIIQNLVLIYYVFHGRRNINSNDLFKF